MKLEFKLFGPITQTKVDGMNHVGYFFDVDPMNEDAAAFIRLNGIPGAMVSRYCEVPADDAETRRIARQQIGQLLEKKTEADYVIA